MADNMYPRLPNDNMYPREITNRRTFLDSAGDDVRRLEEERKKKMQMQRGFNLRDIPAAVGSSIAGGIGNKVDQFETGAFNIFDAVANTAGRVGDFGSAVIGTGKELWQQNKPDFIRALDGDTTYNKYRR